MGSQGSICLASRVTAGEGEETASAPPHVHLGPRSKQQRSVCLCCLLLTTSYRQPLSSDEAHGYDSEAAPSLKKAVRW